MYISNRLSIQIFAVLTLISTGVSIFSLEFYTAAITRFFTGICLGVIDTLLYLNLVETSPTRIRGFIGSFILLFFPLGQLIFALICYGELKSGLVGGEGNMEYRYILLLPFLTVALVVILILPFLEESARRVALNDFQGSLNVVRKISKFNRNRFNKEDGESVIDKMVKKASQDFNIKNKNVNLNTMAVAVTTKRFDFEFDDDLEKKENIDNNQNIENNQNIDNIQNIENNQNIDNIQNKNNSHRSEQSLSLAENFKKMFTYKYYKHSIILCLCALFTGLIFNGIFFLLPTTAPELHSDTFKDVIISVSMEIPANCLISLLIETNYIGRLRGIKIGYFLSLITCMVCFYLDFIKVDYTVINCLLKFFITIPANVVLIYASEIYEGKLRTFGVSAINFWKRVGMIISPFMVTFMGHEFGRMGPYYLFGPLALISFAISLFLDVETRNVPLE